MSAAPQQQNQIAPQNAEEGEEQFPPSPRNFPAVLLGFLQLYPGFVVTLGYLLLTTVGITYDVLFYELFHIPILNFSEPSDFLLAGFRQPVLLLLFLLSNFVLWRLIVKDRKLRQRSLTYKALAEKMEKNKWYSNWVLYPLVVVSYFFTTTTLYARSTASRIRAGEGRTVSIELNAPPVNAKQNQSEPIQMLIGTNSKFLFLYTQGEGKVQAVPIASVARMTLVSVALDAPAAAPGGKPLIQAPPETARSQHEGKP